MRKYLNPDLNSMFNVSFMFNVYLKCNELLCKTRREVVEVVNAISFTYLPDRCLFLLLSDNMNRMCDIDITDDRWCLEKKIPGNIHVYCAFIYNKRHVYFFATK